MPTVASYYQHRLKCMSCSLHFIVCSDYKEWPTYANVKSTISCPECGNNRPFLHWVTKTEGFIFEAVPGREDAELVGVEK